MPEPAEAVPPKKPSAMAQRLAKLGLRSAVDLVLHLPLRYEDETQLHTIAEAVLHPAGLPVQVEGTVKHCEITFRPRRQLVVRLADATGELTLRFLNFYGNQVKLFAVGNRLRARGEVREGFFGAEMVHPTYKMVTDETPLAAALTPVYPSTAGVPQAYLRKAIQSALGRVALPELLPRPILTGVLGKLQLPPLAAAVQRLHNPPPDVALSSLEARDDPAWLRIKFDELLAQQLSLKRAQAARRQHTAPVLPLRSTPDSLVSRFSAALPFVLTGAQQRVWQALQADLATPHPMQRLLQGDVGSGKTIVAALAAAQAIDNGYQAALMAPTEILAEQHYRKLQGWLAPLGVHVVWLAGSLKAKEKRAALAQVAAGTAQLVIGTHALIQEAVSFAKLGLSIIDEQHRFGVGQRLALRNKARDIEQADAAYQPHQLMMSATPIPRTLAMTYYADLDVSVIDELPPGRTPVVTIVINDVRRHEVVERVRAAVQAGRQVYWVCPLIEESEALQLQTAEETHAALVEALPDLQIGLVHGRLPAPDKAAVMAAFIAHQSQVLVATTVIEVGVDVPNASLMVIEHAERFGLSQLHQLRGRVGRGSAESICVLLYQAPLGFTAKQRLATMRATTDGFEIARRDLQLRGPGEFLGARQSGAAMLRFADLEQDAWLVDYARDTAQLLLRAYPEVVEAHLARWLGAKEDYLKV